MAYADDPKDTYVCTVCGKVSMKKSDATKHEKTHKEGTK